MSALLDVVTGSKDRRVPDDMETERAAKKYESKATKGATKTIFEDLDNFQNLDDILQAKFADRLVEKVNDLYNDAKENYVSEEFFNEQNLQVLNGIFYNACKWSFDLSEKLNFLSCHWYEKVRKEEIKERTKLENTKEQSLTGSVISKTKEDDVEQERKRKGCFFGHPASDHKKYRKTKLEVKEGEHWECTECKKCWTRKAICCKHILEFHPQGSAEAAHRLGKKEHTLSLFPIKTQPQPITSSNSMSKSEEDVNMVCPKEEEKTLQQAGSSLSTSQDDFGGNAKDELHLLGWNGLDNEQTEEFFALLGSDHYSDSA